VEPVDGAGIVGGADDGQEGCVTLNIDAECRVDFEIIPKGVK